jgi:hypothetical protein
MALELVTVVRRVVPALLLASILAVGTAALYGLQGEKVAGFRVTSHPVAAAESYWLRKVRYEPNIGKHACRADTGSYVGSIVGVWYGAWPSANGPEGQWLYTVRVAWPVGIPLSEETVVPPVAAAPALSLTATTGKCPDGRP